MATKQTRVTYGGINKDVSKAKFQANRYFDAQNIKLTPVDGQTFGALSNAYGNKLAATIPIPQIDKSAHTIYYGTKSLLYNNTEIDDLPTVGGPQEIIGHVTTTLGVILFSTDSLGTDCIWKIEDLDKDILDLELIYIRNLQFTAEYPIQAIFNYENEKIQKIFWVDGLNYLRYINIEQSVANGFDSNLIDLPESNVDSKSTIDISKPTVEDGRGGGVHTAGVIQYGYTLYNLNGSETSLSPISDIFPLDKGTGEGGGNVNEIVGAMPIVVIEDVDTKYSFIKVFSVKYTTYNGTPEITLIYDGNVGNYDRFTFNDTGTHNLGNLGVAELLFLGADPIKPTHIGTKDSILFAANNTTTAYKLDIDTRAYAYNQVGTQAIIYTDVTYNGAGTIPYTGTPIDVATEGYDVVGEDFDCVNLDLDTYRYKDSGNSGFPGRLIVDAATFSENLTGSAPVNIFEELADTIVVPMESTCDPANTPIEYNIELVPLDVTNDNKTLITTTSDYSVGFAVIVSEDDATNRLVLSSGTATAEIYTTISSITPNRIIELDTTPLDDATIYNTVTPMTAGEAVKVVFTVRSHYNNDVCPYQANDSYATGSYTGDGPYIGPDEQGQTITSNLTVQYAYYSLTQVEQHIKELPLPLTPVNGELNIQNGAFVSDYTGTADIKIEAVVNMNGLGLTDPSNYSIGLFKNDKIVDKQDLNLINAGIITRTFYFNNLSLSISDVIEVRLVSNRRNVSTGESLYADDLNMDVGQNFTVTEVEAGGSNGEGGSGKYITYTLGRTEQDNLGLPLKEARFFKDNEVYRIGIVFFNSIGQASEAKWIADFKAPQGNLEGQYNTLEVSLNNAFYTYLNTLSEEDKPTNYSVVRALRHSTDKTIISQGLMTSMFVQSLTKNYESTDTYDKRADKNPGLLKLPIPLTRGYGNGVGLQDSYYPIFPTKHNRTMNESRSTEDSTRRDGDQDPRVNLQPRDIVIDEIYRDDSPDSKRQQSWQYTKIFQMHSPEATFHLPIATTDSDELHLLGSMRRNEYNIWDYNINYTTLAPELSDKKNFLIDDDPNFYPYSTGGYGIIGPSYRTWKDGEQRTEYKEGGYEERSPADHARRMSVHKTFLPLERANAELSYTIYNRPEVTDIGQSIVSYNNDKDLQYANKLSFMQSDEKNPTNNASPATAISNVSSEGNRCITLALGDSGVESEDRKGLDDLYDDLGIGEWDVELFGEIRREKSYVYSGAIYGGYDISSRSRTEYISIGDVNDITTPIVAIMSPGDTFVQNFVNTRLTKAPGTQYDGSTQVIVETLEYLVESTVNLAERNDTSLKSWDTVVDPTAEEGTNYNRVYSTENVIKTYSPDNLKIREVEQAETEIIASKFKVPGEFVESWVDFLPNEVIYLDGKYGPINNLTIHFDEMYAFQDFAVAKVSIRPRVQTQGSDGISIELGKGDILYDYNYITTKSGSINKWGVVSTNSGLYYADVVNKQFQRIQKSIEGISEAQGLHSFLRTNLNREELREDNPVMGKGIAMGYDNVNGDIYTSVKQTEDSFNVSFNEKLDTYSSFYSYVPSRFITKGERLFTVSPLNDELYLHYDGDYQTYYGTKYESSITLLVNTDNPHSEKVFNSLEFDSEVTLAGEDLADITIDSVQAWTDYQEGDKITLVLNNNIRRKFRTWRANIPRESGTRNRLRDKWVYIKLGFNPTDDKKLVLHDMIIGYAETE